MSKAAVNEWPSGPWRSVRPTEPGRRARCRSKAWRMPIVRASSAKEQGAGAAGVYLIAPLDAIASEILHRTQL
jgi:hypothetical protein